MTYRYEWSPNARVRGANVVSAEAVAALQQEYEANGLTLLPEDLVAESAFPEAPTHALFEWDDRVAGQQWRVVQARKALRSIQVVRDDGRVIRPAFVHVVVEEGGRSRDGYMSTLRALASEQTRHFVLKDAMRQLQGLRNRYQHLDELGHVWEAIEEGAKDTVGT